MLIDFNGVLGTFMSCVGYRGGELEGIYGHGKCMVAVWYVIYGQVYCHETHAILSQFFINMVDKGE
jgi:hypothetical protein